MRTAAVVLVLLAAGCGWFGDGGTDPTAAGSPSTEAADPCPESEAAELGDPYRGGDFAEFTVDRADRYWVTVRDFPEGGFLDPDIGRSAVTIGSLDQPPTFDEQRSSVGNVDVEVHVVEATWSAVDLEEGGHWLWSSNGGDVAVKSCHDATVTVEHEVVIQ